MSTTLLEKLILSYKNAGNQELSSLFEEVLLLKNRKLYHQLTEKLLVIVKRPELQNEELLKLYNGFLKELEPKVKPLSMAVIIVQVSSQFKTPEEAIEFLEKKKKDFKGNNESYALLVTAQARVYGSEKNFDKAKELLEEVQHVIDNNLGIDPMVSSQYYRVLAIHHKDQVNAGEFYKAGLLYLAYTPLESIGPDVRKMLARDLAFAGLVAENVYGLGEVLSHPISDSLREDKSFTWLLELMNAFNSGKINVWSELKGKYKDHIKENQTLALNLERLDEKIVILALIDLIWSKPADGRNLPFSEVEKVTHLPFNKVEIIVMRAFCLGLVKGEIDQVRKMIVVSSVTPRVLSFEQIGELQERVKSWSKHVHSTLVDIENNTQELLK